LGGKKGCLPGPAKCLRWPLAALLIRPPAFFSQHQSIHIWPQPDFFFDFYFYFEGGQKPSIPELFAFLFLKNINEILCWAENLPGEMAVRTPHQ
jgi:hypothetical protein